MGSRTMEISSKFYPTSFVVLSVLEKSCTTKPTLEPIVASIGSILPKYWKQTPASGRRRTTGQYTKLRERKTPSHRLHGLLVWWRAFATQARSYSLIFRL